MKASLPRTAAFTWSPYNLYSSSPQMATGTVAGALDESFSSDSVLELWQLPVGQTPAAEGSHAAEPQVLGSVTASARFNRLAWGYVHGNKPRGLIAGGLENGELGVWDAQALSDAASAPGAQQLRNSVHTGPVRGLDFNRLQPNLLASGAVNAEVYVWDLNAPQKPYTPGSRSQRLGEISSLGWNPQVSHVLATSSLNGFTSVWDLRHKREVVALAYGGGAGTAGTGFGGQGYNANALAAGGRRGMSAVAWHPGVATRVATASEDDASPVIMLWDLRNSRAPERILTGHDKGVLALSWCRQDEDLLLACGKDNRTTCWNPQTCELVAEMPPANNWAFDVQWCASNPNMLATASFDGHIGIHSLQNTAPDDDGAAQAQATAHLQGADLFGALGEQPQVEAHVMSLTQPPKWLRRPTSAAFGFGGQLVSVRQPGPGATGFDVHLHHVRTEPHIAERAERLSAALSTGALPEFCHEQSQSPQTRADDVPNWKALQTLFQAGSREELVSLLGFNREDLTARVTEAVGALGLGEVDEEEKPPADASADPQAPAPGAEAADGADGGLFGAAGDSGQAFFDNLQAGGADAGAAPAAAPVPAAAKAAALSPFRIHPQGKQDPDHLVTRALVLGDFESAVSLFVSKDRFAEALVLATRAGPELLAKTQRAFFKRHAEQNPCLRLLQSIVLGDLTDVVANADLSEWHEIFVVLCTFARAEDFNALSERLGQRLEDRYLQQRAASGAQPSHEVRELRKDAVLCYLAAGRLEKVTGMWIDEMKEEELAIRAQARDVNSEAADQASLYSAHAEALQTFMEKIAVFQAAVGYEDAELQPPMPNADGSVPPREFKLAALYDYILEYVDLLADQGLVDVALRFIAYTPADYIPGAGRRISTTGEWAHDRLLQAGDTSAYTHPAPARSAYAPAASAAPAYGAPPAAAYDPYYGSAPAAAQPPPPPPAASGPPPAVAPPPPTVPAVPTVPMVPTPEPTAAAGPSPYAPPQAGPYGAAAPPPATYGGAYAPPSVPGTAPPAAGPPPAQMAQPAPPPPLKRDKGGWNDVPTMEPPKRAPSSMAGRAHTPAITSPFPNQPAYAPGPGAPPQGPPQGPPPGPPRGPPGMPPPPRGATPGARPPPPAAPPAAMPPPPRPGAAPQGAAPAGAVRPPPNPYEPAPGSMSPAVPQGAAYQANGGAPPMRPPMRPPPQGARPGMPPPPMRGPSGAPHSAPPMRAQHTGPAAHGTPRTPGPPGVPLPPVSPRPGFVPGTPGRQGGRLPGSSVPPTPRSATPAGGGFGAPPTPRQHAKPGFKYPPGDRAHIPPAVRPVVQSLQREVQRLHSINAQPKRILDDADRRVQLLLDLLNNELVDPRAVPLLQQLGQALDARDQQGALQLHVQLATIASGDFAASLVGVKFLIAKLLT